MVDTQKVIAARAVVAADEATLTALEGSLMTAGQITQLHTAQTNLAQSRYILKTLDVLP